MAQKYEYYDTGNDSSSASYADHWYSQTFTPLTAHKITSVKLLLSKKGSPGILTVSIKATSGGHPYGPDLCSGTTNGNTLPTGYPYEWREITLGAGHNLAAGTKYAIVLCALDGSYGNEAWWEMDFSSPTYARGNREWSINSGSSWTSDTNADLMFEEWGEPISAPTVSTVAADNVEQTTANPKGNVTATGGENPTRYIDYDTDSGAPYANSKDCGVGGIGVYNSNLTDLIPGTKYYYRARAVNSGGTGTGSEMTFTTESVLGSKSANMAAKMVAAGLI